MTVDDDSLICELRDEADLCRNEGVEELAELLDAAATRIEQFVRLDANVQAEAVCGQAEKLRPCTCPPGERPEDCQNKYALGECLERAKSDGQAAMDLK
jgi:hypothetical protein